MWKSAAVVARARPAGSTRAAATPHPLREHLPSMSRCRLSPAHTQHRSCVFAFPTPFPMATDTVTLRWHGLVLASTSPAHRQTLLASGMFAADESLWTHARAVVCVTQVRKLVRPQCAGRVTCITGHADAPQSCCWSRGPAFSLHAA